MNILCLDIGNTHTHFGILKNGTALTAGEIPTNALECPETGVPALIARLENDTGVDGISFCSVVPNATDRLEKILKKNKIPQWHLRHDACPGLGINYPRPQEIGEDRLANCIGAQVAFGAPAIVIDMGTAVTFDILSHKGYEGGIIAPGVGIMTRYLHEQTALLPALDPADLLVSTGIGKSTLDAMRLGCAVGFSGMIDALLATVISQMEKWHLPNPAIIATGGTAGILPKSWKNKIHWRPDITLLGLETAFTRGIGK